MGLRVDCRKVEWPAVRTLSDSSFFRVFNLLVATGNPGQRRQSWTVDGVRFERERHTFAGKTHSFAIDVFSVSQTGRCRWSLTVAKEIWWTANHEHMIKMQNWSKLTDGSRRDVLAWLRAQERAMERQVDTGVDHDVTPG